MKSLTSINEILSKWQDFSSSINQITDENDSFLKQVYGMTGCFGSFYLKDLSKAEYYRNIYKNNITSSIDFVIVVPDEFEANNVYQDLISNFEEAEVYLFPSWGVIPYRSAATGSSVFGKRAGILSKLARPVDFQTKQITRIFIITQRSFISPLPSPEYIKTLSFTLKKKASIDTVKTANELTKLGYMRVSKVNLPGEFSLRGEVLDIFLPLAQNPARVIFDFDQIEAIKLFDAETQTTIGSVDQIDVSPVKEVLWNDEFINRLEDKLDEYQKTAITLEEGGAEAGKLPSGIVDSPSEAGIIPSGADNSPSEAGIIPSEADNSPSEPSTSPSGGVHLAFTAEALEQEERILNQLRTTKQAEGEEHYYQLLWDRQYSFLDYLNSNACVFYFDYDRLVNAVLSINRENTSMYRKTRETQPVLPPERITFDFNSLVSVTKRQIQLRTITKEVDINFEIEPAHSYFGNIKYMKEELEAFQKDDWDIFIYTDNENQKLRLEQLFKEFIEVEAPLKPVTLIPKPVSAGFSIPAIKLLVIQENEIFGRRKYVSKTVNKAKSQAIDTFVELNPGDYVVHVNYGIGKFHGIERVKSLGNERDYIKLEYLDEEYAFVPIEQVNLVQRYIGNEGEKPKLDRIGSKSWENRKEKVKKSVEEIAQKLIDLYSRRKASVGFAFPKEIEWQNAFEAAFPYEDTPDQITVTEEIKADMEKPVPMDRLICGDVGYGKTEIAMRAAFKAVMGGKQVAFLAPTTILAEQHYETCIERFKNFPVKIARMSRFVAPAEQKKILNKLMMGEIDILIGTHRIIQKDVVFKNLGLMIIDEEQRFGVKDKEKLKEMKHNVDCLTMSATPIPRTLHMSLLKIRDMSLLTTPPQSRQPIETIIDEYSDDRIAQAIRNEIERGGQIFYLHNRVESLLEVRQRVERIVPEVLVDVAHGQMTSNELDDIFHRFKMGGFHVLIATTIIENGIDIPNVNTIIIDRADMYGVSQLYQLRGRVGRSDRKAYAYLLYPENKALSEVAMKRLQVISDFTELGSGFKIAMKDMEIRGAGNLLGKDQSGDVYAVGFDLYVKLLNEAVNRLMAQKDYNAASEVLMELEYTGYIPDNYVTNAQIKMEIYKKIAAITTEAEFDSVVAELNDRFGPIPDEVSSLLALAEIRIVCKKLNISSIKERKGEVQIEFSSTANISIDKFMKLIRENPGTIRLNSTMANAIFIKLGNIGLKEKSEFIREKLIKLL